MQQLQPSCSSRTYYRPDALSVAHSSSTELGWRIYMYNNTGGFRGPIRPCPNPATAPIQSDSLAIKLVKLVPRATKCQILRLKCTKFDFRWGSASDPSGGAYSAPPGPLAVFKGRTSKGTEGKGRGRKGRERDWEGRGAEGKLMQTPEWCMLIYCNSHYATFHSALRDGTRQRKVSRSGWDVKDWSHKPILTRYTSEQVLWCCRLVNTGKIASCTSLRAGDCSTEISIPEWRCRTVCRCQAVSCSHHHSASSPAQQHAITVHNRTQIHQGLPVVSPVCSYVVK